MNNFKNIDKLISEIKMLDDKIKEMESTLPAHSVKPEMIQKIENLEEELNNKRKKLNQMRLNQI